MKQIVEYFSHNKKLSLISEYLLNKTNKQNKKTSKLDSWEACDGTKYIPADIMHQYIIDALELNWLKAEDVLKDFEIEIDNKEHEAKVHADYVNHTLKNYSKFEKTLKEILEQSPYENKTDDILDKLYDNYLPVFSEIIFGK